MEIKERKISGAYEINLKPHLDERGFFMRTYDKQIFSRFPIEREWVQENQSRSDKKGIVRGLHFQFPPYCETKLVRVIRGAIFDVFVDLRKNSPTLGMWEAIELSEQNKTAILIPRGCAHGFCTLTEESEIVYKVDNYYHSEAEGGIFWQDKTLNVSWPVSIPLISKKDSRLPSFIDFIDKWQGLES